MEVKSLLKALESEKAEDFLVKMYGKAGVLKNRERYVHVVEEFVKKFGERPVSLFSSAGRTEISGNHTDHNHE